MRKLTKSEYINILNQVSEDEKVLKEILKNENELSRVQELRFALRGIREHKKFLKEIIRKF